MKRVGGHLDASLGDVQFHVHDPESYWWKHTELVDTEGFAGRAGLRHLVVDVGHLALAGRDAHQVVT